MLAETGSFEGGVGDLSVQDIETRFDSFVFFFFFLFRLFCFLFKKILAIRFPFDQRSIPIDYNIHLRLVDRTIDSVYSSTDRF